MIYPWVIKHRCRKSKQKNRTWSNYFHCFSSSNRCTFKLHKTLYISDFLLSSITVFTMPPSPVLWPWIGQTHLFDAWSHTYRLSCKINNYREHWGVGFVGTSGFPRRFHCTAWLVSSNIPRLKQMDQHNQVIKRVTASVLLSGTILETFLCNSSTSSFEWGSSVYVAVK